MLVSIVIRTLNEERYLGELLASIEGQVDDRLKTEVILVDSGSVDRTLEIARSYKCKIVQITRNEFSFGRSLNKGCEAAAGRIVVMISGHCVPSAKNWLKLLCHPLLDGSAGYVYGRQVGGPGSRYSECRIFAKHYPEKSRIPQDGFYCNNANSAILREVWEKYRFDEELTGLEDMALAKSYTNDGGKIAYVAEACVYHHHEEKWQNVRRRFEREAIALQRIMPQVHVHGWDMVRYICYSIWLDFKNARREKVLIGKAVEIVIYRYLQYFGSYIGNHNHRKLSHAQKEEYFYPDEYHGKDLKEKHEEESRRAAANEG